MQFELKGGIIIKYIITNCCCTLFSEINSIANFKIQFINTGKNRKTTNLSVPVRFWF